MINLNIQIGAGPAHRAAPAGQASTTKPKLTTIKELAEVIKMDRSAARRYVLRLGIEPKRARTSSSGFQTALVFTPEQVEQVVQARSADGYC